MTQKSHSQAYTPKKPVMKRHMYPIVHYSTIYITRTWKQPSCPLTDEWVKKQWYIYIVEYYSVIRRNTFESVLTRWMILEPIIQSEVSQKEKHKYRILTHICETQKNGTEKFIYRAAMRNRQTDIENRLMDMGRGEENVRCMESVTRKLILPYVKQRANGNLLYSSGNSNRGSVSTQKGGMGRDMEGRFQKEGYLYTYG